MAIFTAYTSFADTDIYAFGGTLISATSSKISLIDPIGSSALNYADLRVDYGGSFKYLGGDLSSGTLRSATVYVNSVKYYSVTGTYDVLTYDYYALGSTDNFLSYVFGGNDTFNGSKQNDFFWFLGTGNDKFYGNGGNDLIATNVGYKSTVDGGSGDDYILMYGNNDSVKGGTGADIFNIEFWNDSDKDVISDFNVSQGDMIDIAMTGFAYDGTDTFYYNTATTEFEPYVYQLSVVSGTSASQDFDNYFIYDKKTGNLYYDADATGYTYSSELIVNFSNKPAFTVTQLSDQVINISDSSSYSLPFLTYFIAANNPFGY